MSIKNWPGGRISSVPPTPSGPFENSSASGVWTLDQVAYWRSQNQWPTSGNIAPDPFFENVTMLLHGDGTNGAQNNTFLDSSTNNFTITRNGNTTQGSFSPYGPNWSNYFDGSTDRLRITNTGVLDLGSGDFTVECWWFSNKALNAYAIEYAFLFGKGNSIGAGTWSLGIYQSKIYFSTSAFTLQGSTNLTANSWNHFAVTRSGSTVRVFTNGVLDGTTTSSQNITSSTSFNIGDRQPSDPSGQYPFNGYISNVRTVVGSALYTASFTPSTTPLTVISGTSLLTCADNRFIDDSTNNYAITVNGGASVQRFSPFAPPAAYNPATIGGSGYFDGSGDYLTVPSNSAFDLGTGDFTVEAWVYRTTSTTGYETLLGFDVAGGMLFQIYQNQLDYGIRATSSTQSGVTVPSNCWVHLAISRQSGTVRQFQNGVLVNSFSNSQNFTNSTQAIVSGFSTSAGQVTGYIANLRLVKGTAVYTATFTLPTAPLTAVSGTSLLNNFTNGAIFDNAMMNDLETVGNAQISTSVVKFGTGSMFFNGNTDYLAAPPSPNTILGTGNFTIEGWVYTASTPTVDGVFEISAVRLNANPVLGLGFMNGQANIIAAGINPTPTYTLPLSQWVHFAMVRNSGTTTLYMAGTSIWSTADTTNYTAQLLTVGAFYALPYGWNGYIDDFRVTKGYARYTANFTPPTAAFPNT